MNEIEGLVVEDLSKLKPVAWGSLYTDGWQFFKHEKEEGDE